ncbi:MAG: hypothetical protein ABR958_06160 [Dehalococcoidales bacterium]
MVHGEKGQALPMVLIAIALGALVIPPFLNHTGASLIGSRIYAQGLAAQYATDSGAEHAIWNLKYGGLSNNLTLVGDNVSYALGESVNGLSVNIIVAKTGDPSTYSIVSSAGGSALNVSASVNSTDTSILTWHFE